MWGHVGATQALGLVADSNSFRGAWLSPAMSDLESQLPPSREQSKSMFVCEGNSQI